MGSMWGRAPNPGSRYSCPCSLFAFVVLASEGAQILRKNSYSINQCWRTECGIATQWDRKSFFCRCMPRIYVDAFCF